MKIFKHTYWKELSCLVMLLSFCLLSQAQNTLVLNGGITVLNGGTAGTPVYLVVNESNTAGITRLNGGGHIHSENQYNFVKWISGTGIGNYVIPFGVGGNATDYIPFTFNKTTAGNSDLDMSTWATNQQNIPHAGISNVGAVTSMTGLADSVVSALDRFWDIRSSATADLTFSYLGVENTTASPTDTVKAQHWNGTSWDAQAGPGNLGIVAGVGTVGPIPGQSTFSPWILSVIPTCPTAAISYANTPFCTNDVTTQNVTFSGGLGGGYSSTPAGLTLDALTGDIIPNTSTAGTYTVTYTIALTATCPEFTVDAIVTINPIATTNDVATICEGTTILLGGAMQTTAGFYNDTLQTTLGCDSLIITELIVNPVDTIISTASICLGEDTLLGGVLQTTAGTYYDIFQSTLGCDSVVETTLSINLLPIVVASSDDTICPGEITNISATGGINYTWDNGLGSGQNQPVNPLITTVYTVTGTDANNCSNTDNVEITVELGTIADAGIDQEICIDEVSFGLNGNIPLIAGESGLWTILNSGILIDPLLSSATGSELLLGENVFVWTISNAACPPSSASVTINVIDCEPSALLIPNVFTPNEDGFNDFFTVDGIGLESVEGEIFNRWGQKMFSWNNVNGGWDGRTTSGSEAPDGTYFFIITAKGVDGTEYFEKGTFSLIR
ncbi:MAG: gliding motility-associated C-terminal domain-containing protein [Flavobacteriales bacterium]|nr:gliding motility-associated C-terminal domain-containing protein [Flavobacteriales bacterium]